MAGAPTVFGREEDGKAQAMTVMFRLGDVDLENANLGKAHGAYQKALN